MTFFRHDYSASSNLPSTKSGDAAASFNWNPGEEAAGEAESEDCRSRWCQALSPKGLCRAALALLDSTTPLQP